MHKIIRRFVITGIILVSLVIPLFITLAQINASQKSYLPIVSNYLSPSATPTKQPTPTVTTTPGPGKDPIIFFTSDLVSGSSVSRAQLVVNLILNLMSQH